jgi:hypothetical protein
VNVDVYEESSTLRKLKLFGELLGRTTTLFFIKSMIIRSTGFDEDEIPNRKGSNK